MEETAKTKDGVLAPAKERFTRVLGCAWRGIYHIETPIHKENEGTKYERWWFSTHTDLSTFDFDTLTRLVVAAHDQCVRVAISSSGPRMVKVELWARQGRNGDFSERHPTIEEAVENVRKWWK